MSLSFDGILCDLDGVVYSGANAIPYAVESLNEVIDADIPVAFVTNNASRSPETVAAHLQDLGLKVQPDNIHTSAQVASDLLLEHARTHGNEGSEVLVVGTEYLGQLVRDRGFQPVDNATTASPTYIIQGFSPDLRWEHLAQASFALAQDAVWVATNLDASIPRAEGIAPGNGSMVAAITHATGKEPHLVGGKPGVAIFKHAAQQHGMSSPLVIGDRLDTDVQGGKDAGFGAAMVLTGIHQEEDIGSAEPHRRPDVVLRNLSDLRISEGKVWV